MSYSADLNQLAVTAAAWVFRALVGVAWRAWRERRAAWRVPRWRPEQGGLLWVGKPSSL